MNAEHYRRKAEECRRLAEAENNAGTKAEWLKLAASWSELAKQAEGAEARPERSSITHVLGSLVRRI